MPRPTARLANCYAPLTLPGSAETTAEGPTGISALRSGKCSTSDSSISEDSPRDSHSLRRLCLETGVTGQLGSSLVELGHTKVMCEVSLTTTNYPSGIAPDMERGILYCQVEFAPSFGVNLADQMSRTAMPLDSTISSGKLTSELMTKEADLSFQLSSALSPAIPLEDFPKFVLRVDATVLQDDGSVLSACIIGASMALADARVELYDVVSSCTVAVAAEAGNGGADGVAYLADPTAKESSKCPAEMCLAMLPNHKEVTLWNQSGRLAPSMANRAMELCRDGCRTMHKFMREKLISDS